MSEKKDEAPPSLEEQIEANAALMFSYEEVEIITGLQVGTIQHNESHRNHYRRGRLRALAEVRRSVADMAKRGSSPAQKQFLQLAEESE